MTRRITTAAILLVTALGTSAFAKGHDQGAGPNGSPATPAGENVGAETATAAQGLGKGPNSGEARGKSGDAGKK